MACGDLGWFKVDARPGEPDFGQLQPCACRADERMARLADLSGLKPSERRIRLGHLVAHDANTKKMIAAAARFAQEPRGWLYLWGAPGNGKTLVLQGIVNQCTQRGIPAIYTTFSDLLDLMRATFDRDEGESYHARFTRLQSIPVLAIDEFDKVNDTAFVQEFRSKLMDHRYRDGIAGNLATVFASNSDPELDLPGWLWSRVRDGRFKVFRNTGGDVRFAAGWGDV